METVSDHNVCLTWPLLAQSNYAVAILNVGAPAGGMNAAVRSAVRVALAHGHKVYGVHDGFEGLANGSVRMSFIIFVCLLWLNFNSCR